MDENLLINNLFSVKNKVVVITGGSSGIGLMMANGFVANGAKVRFLKYCVLNELGLYYIKEERCL